MPVAKLKPKPKPQTLEGLRNVGAAALADFRLLGISSIGELADQKADDLYLKLSRLTGQQHDPCVHDVFAATIHEARSGEAVDWWHYTAARKSRQKAGDFPTLSLSDLLG